MIADQILELGISLFLWVPFFLFPFQAIGRYGLLKKAGIPGWKGLVPFYGEYLQYQISWKTDWFWFHLLSVGGRFLCYIAFAGGVLYRAGSVFTLVELMGMLVMTLPDVVIALIGLCVRYLAMEHLAEAFGRSKNFALGLYLLNPLFMLMLAYRPGPYRRNKEKEYNELEAAKQ